MTFVVIVGGIFLIFSGTGIFKHHDLLTMVFFIPVAWSAALPASLNGLLIAVLKNLIFK